MKKSAHILPISLALVFVLAPFFYAHAQQTNQPEIQQQDEENSIYFNNALSSNISFSDFGNNVNTEEKSQTNGTTPDNSIEIQTNSQTNSLDQEQSKVASVVPEKKNGFSLFGWFAKIL